MPASATKEAHDATAPVEPQGVMRALQIQAPEDHPALVQGAGRRKEGFTLLGQFDSCLTTLGRSTMRDWFRKPLLDVAAIARRHDAIELFAQEALGERVQAIAKQLRKVKDVPALLRLVRTATAAPRHWDALAASLRGLLAIRALLDGVESAGGSGDGVPDLVVQMQVRPAQEEAGGGRARPRTRPPAAILPPLLSAVQGAIASPVAEVSGLLETVLDLEGIGPGDLGVHIKAGVSEDLDKWRRVLDNLDSILSEEGTRVLSSLAPHGVQELALVFLPRGEPCPRPQRRIGPASVSGCPCPHCTRSGLRGARARLWPRRPAARGMPHFLLRAGPPLPENAHNGHAGRGIAPHIAPCALCRLGSRRRPRHRANAPLPHPAARAAAGRPPRAGARCRALHHGRAGGAGLGRGGGTA